MMKKVYRVFWLAVGVCCVLQGAPKRAGELGRSAFADSEISTCFPYKAHEANLKEFRLGLEFAATPSNNVEIAVGRDADGDGVLGLEEIGMVAGWDCGRWFAGNAGNRVAAEEEGVAGAKKLRIAYAVGDGGALKGVGFYDGERAILAGLSGEAPGWLYDAGWDMVRVTARGVDEHFAHFEVKTTPWGFRIILK